ncbi:uncharacterized protein GIQ15_00319 [Arthroderma uncinatum]|uniref:uncharacterized protein n=1 Tax=Arthroderma uncinatum TaxID=74035 RepID=UPI00144AED27|nr:uncharacterized protein GIQ15_00319 [Arthroderma uncinatum]KAF3490802.1 hypothetical protein GIQ15_00319 [Arthroderma uncinatum]
MLTPILSRTYWLYQDITLQQRAVILDQAWLELNTTVLLEPSVSPRGDSTSRHEGLHSVTAGLNFVLISDQIPPLACATGGDYPVSNIEIYNQISTPSGNILSAVEPAVALRRSGLTMGAEDKLVLARKIGRTELLVSIWTGFGIATLLLASRFAIRMRLHRRLFWDDILAGLAYLFLLGHNILATLSAPTVYLLLHLYENNQGLLMPGVLRDIDHLAKLVFASNFLFRFCIYSVKASLLALLWRLFRSLPAFRRAWWVIAGVAVIGFLISIIMPTVACPSVTALGCISPKNLKLEAISMYMTTIADVLTDILIMSVPVAFVLKSSLPASQKLGLVGLFLLGLAVVVMAILRNLETDGKSKHPPPSWLLFWSAMEATVAVMVSCFASYKSLFTSHARPTAYQYQSGYSTSVAVSSRVGANKNWTDTDSREEIMRRTEFEVTYEMAPIPEQPLPSPSWPTKTR